MNQDGGQVYIRGPRDVYDLIGREMRGEREVVKLVSLDSQNRVINFETIANGEVDITLLRPREVFESALRNSAASVVLVHNHPSGSLYPSDTDVEVTRKLARIGRLIGVQLQDHVIIGDGGYTSLKALGVIR